MKTRGNVKSDPLDGHRRKVLKSVWGARVTFLKVLTFDQLLFPVDPFSLTLRTPTPTSNNQSLASGNFLGSHAMRRSHKPVTAPAWRTKPIIETSHKNDLPFGHRVSEISQFKQRGSSRRTRCRARWSVCIHTSGQ